MFTKCITAGSSFLVLRSHFVMIRLAYARTVSVPSMFWDKPARIDTLLASVSKMNWWLKSLRPSIGALVGQNCKVSKAD